MGLGVFLSNSRLQKRMKRIQNEAPRQGEKGSRASLTIRYNWIDTAHEVIRTSLSRRAKQGSNWVQVRMRGDPA